MTIAAILVSFDRTHDAMATARDVGSVIDAVYIVDNAPAEAPPLVGEARVLVNRNKGGLAGAYNRALAEMQRERPDITHVLFLDDDTGAASLAAFLQDDVTRGARENSRIAAVAPAYVDARTGIRGKHIQLDRFSFKMVDRLVDEPTPVTFIINSMSLWRLSALREIGPYDETLGVDHIDTDYCLRAKAAGFSILLNPRVAFAHTIGRRQAFKFMGRQMQAGGHGPSRRHMIGRNTVILGRRFGLRYPAFAFISAARLVYEIVGISVAEPNKRAKLAALFRGTVEGLRFAD